MYKMGNSSLIFYLDMSKPVKTIDDEAGFARSRKPGNYLLTEEALADEIGRGCGHENMARVLTQATEGRKRDREGLVLFRTGEGS